MVGGTLDYLNHNPKYKDYGWPLAILGLIWFFTLPWLTKRAANYMVSHNVKMWAAMKLAVYDLRLILAFIPFVGHWFIPSKDEEDDA